MDHPVNHIDHVFWDMEMPTSLVTVVGMITFKDMVPLPALERIVDERLLQYEKFQQCIIIKDNKPVWHDDEMFDKHAHIHHVALPAPGDYKALQALVSDLMAKPLDYSKPLWEVYLIDGYNGGSVVLWRIHHAIADGIALIKVVFSMTGTTVEESLEEIHYFKEPKKEKGFLLDKIRAQLDHALHLGEDIYREAVNLVQNPDQLKDALRNTWETTRELSRLVTDEARTDSYYKGRLSVVKKAAWSKPVSLDKIKAVGKQEGGTVNDVLLSLMTGAIRNHLLEHNEDLSKPFRIVCPVNWRKQKRIHIENSIGMISLELPVHEADFGERLKIITAKTRKLKRSLEPVAVYTMLNIAGDLLPKKLEIKAAEYFGDRIMGVLSNVPGPTQRIYFGGKEVDEFMFWIPQSNALGVGISIMSYSGNVTVGVATDAHIIDDPDVIMKAFETEFEAMVAEYLQ